MRIFRQLQRYLVKIHLPGGLRLWSTILSLAFVGHSIFSNSDNLSEIPLTINIFWWLFHGFWISIFSLIVNAIAWRSLLFWLGCNSRNVDLLSLFLRSNLLKYLPGGIWHFVARLRALKVHIGSEKAFASVLLEPLLMVSAAFLWIPFGGLQSGFAILCIFPALLFLKELRIPFLKRLERLKANQLKRIFLEIRYENSIEKPILQMDDYPFRPMVLEMIFVFLRFSGFWFCLNAFSVDSFIPFLHWLAVFSFAWTIGLVVPAAPGGLGIFEAILLLRVGSLVPEAPFLASLLCYRLIVTLADLFTAFAVVFKRTLKSST